MKSEKANIAGLKASQPNLSLGYQMILKSPITHQDTFHLECILESSSHRAPRWLSSLGPYTPEQAQTKSSATPFSNTLIENRPIAQSTFSKTLLSQTSNTPLAVLIASRTTQSRNGLTQRLRTTKEFKEANLVSWKQTISHFHSLRRFLQISRFWGLFNPLTFQDSSRKLI